jgi:G:T-mismatch repair DNA endonuclease (very short patch repair protein)
MKTSICKQCHKVFEYKYGNRKFCNHQCHLEYQRIPENNTMYHKKSWSKGLNKYNNKIIMQVSKTNTGKRKKEYIKIICLNCKKEFEVQPQYKDRRFCSLKCASSGVYNGNYGTKKLLTKICPVCNIMFKTYTNKYCSRKCSGIENRKVDIDKWYYKKLNKNNRVWLCPICNKYNNIVRLRSHIRKHNLSIRQFIKIYKNERVNIENSININKELIKNKNTDFKKLSNSIINYFIKIKGTDEELSRNHNISKSRIKLYKSSKGKKLRRQQQIRTIKQIVNHKIKCFNTKPELLLKEILDKNNILYIQQKHIKHLFVFDFFIPKYDIFIECQGDFWHRNPSIIHKKIYLCQEKKMLSDLNKRNNILNQDKYRLLCFWEKSLNENIDEVEKILLSNLNKGDKIVEY